MQKHEQGFTLIELLISVTIALIISAAIFGIYANSAGTSAAMLKSSKLNQELYSLMLVMSNDIRRAGYWEPDSLEKLESPEDNPFTQDETELVLINDFASNNPILGKGLDAITGEPLLAECILYTFDENGKTTSVKGEPEKDELFGFRFNSDTNTVEMRDGWNAYAYDESTPVKVNDDCSDNKGNWKAVTDSNTVKITGLTFTRVGSECIYANFPEVRDPDADYDLNGINNDEPIDCYDLSTLPDDYKDDLKADTVAPIYSDYVDSILTVEKRQIRIALSAELVSDPSVKATLVQDVRVRNDRVKEWKIQ